MSTANEPTVLTIGHSSHPIERFVALLRQHGVTAVADVRSAPYSRHQPQFNKDLLQRSLKDAGIAYIFLGKELGARSEDRSCYENGRVQSEEHTSELQSRRDLVCRLLLEKKKKLQVCDVMHKT